MRTALFAILLPAVYQVAVAQQPVTISLGGGINSSSSALKEKTYLGNGYNVQADVFIPLLHKNNGRFSLGLLAGGDYYTHKNLAPDPNNLQDVYKLYNGDLTITNAREGGAVSNGMTGILGVEAGIGFGAFTLSPSISGGYFSFKQNGFAQNTTVQVNGATQNITLANIPAARRSGFTAIPRLKISYPLTQAISIYTAAAIHTGSTITAQQNGLKPQGGFNDKHTYEPSQLSAGTLVSKDLSAGYQTMQFNVGVSLKVGGKTRQTQGSSFGEKVSGGLQSGAGALGQGSAASAKSGIGGMAKPGGAVSSSYAAGRMMQSDSTKSTHSMPSRLSMTPTTARQTQNPSFGEKKGENPLYEASGNSGQNPMHQAVAKPGNPIGGIIVKGGKNPGGAMITATSDNNGTFELNKLEAGNYTFTLTIPQDVIVRGWDPEKAKPVAGKATTTRQTQGNTFGEKVSGGLQSGASAVAQGAKPGNPIGGIIVKGGKNPGGNYTNLTVSENGTIQFEVEEAGNYKFIIQTPDDTPPNNTKKKTVEKATSGLKDTLKTNV